MGTFFPDPCGISRRIVVRGDVLCQEFQVHQFPIVVVIELLLGQIADAAEQELPQRLRQRGQRLPERRSGGLQLGQLQGAEGGLLQQEAGRKFIQTRVRVARIWVFSTLLLTIHDVFSVTCRRRKGANIPASATARTHRRGRPPPTTLWNMG